MRTLAVMLIIVGALSLAYGGISYTKNREVLDIGPIEANVKEKKVIPFSPVVGVLALGVGVVLLYGSRRTV